MKRSVGDECRKQFRKLMTTDFPHFVVDKEQEIPRGALAWKFIHPRGLFLHIVLVIYHHNGRDSFWVEAGWTLNGPLPSSSIGTSREEFLAKPCYWSLSQLWEKNHREWKFYFRPEKWEPLELAARIAQAVEPAIQEIREGMKQHLVPFFDEIVRRQGTASTDTHGAMLG